MRTRLLSFVLSLCMIIALLPVAVSADDNDGNSHTIKIENVPSIAIAGNSPTMDTSIKVIKGDTGDVVYYFDVVGKISYIKDHGEWMLLNVANNTLTIYSSKITEGDLAVGEYQIQLYAVRDYYYDKTSYEDAAKLTITVTVADPCVHDFKWIIDKEPSYTETGLRHEECTECGEKRSLNTVIDKLEREDPPIIIMNAYISFETNGGEKLEMLSTLFGMEIDLTKYVPEREGYEFDGWYMDAELTESVTSIRAAGTTTVYAKWTREELPFKDIDSDSEYYDDIEFVYSEGLMIGTSDNEFSPDLTLTRGMVTTILWRMSGSPVVNYPMLFGDVDEEAYYAEAIRWASAEKIVNGIGDDIFAPDAEVTREQLATIIYRYVQKNGGGFTGMWYFPLNFGDADAISEYADEAMHWCVMNGIIEADEDNNLRPSDPATRAETAHAYHILSTVNS